MRDMAEFASVAWMPRGEGEAAAAARRARAAGSGDRRSSPATTTARRGPSPASGAIAFPKEADAAVERIWNLTPDPREADVVWAGCEPHSLWRSADGGHHFELNTALWDHPHRPEWMPGAGGGGRPHDRAARGRVDARRDEHRRRVPVCRQRLRLGAGEPRDQGGLPARGVPGVQPVRAPHRRRRRRPRAACTRRTTVASTGPTTPATAGSRSLPDVPNDFGFVVLAHPSQGDTAWVDPDRRRDHVPAGRPPAAAGAPTTRGRRGARPGRGCRTTTTRPCCATPRT